MEMICMFNKTLFEEICKDYGVELVESNNEGFTLTDSPKIYKNEDDFKDLLFEFLGTSAIKQSSSGYNYKLINRTYPINIDDSFELIAC